MNKGHFYRNFSAHLRDMRDDVLGIEKTAAMLQSRHNLTYNDALVRLLIAGYRTIAEQPDYASPEIAEHIENAKLYAIAKHMVARKRELGEMYRELGSEGVGQIIADAKLNIDANELLAEANKFQIVVPASSKSEVYARWLLEILGDGKEHSVEQIVERAVREGVMTSSERNDEQHQSDYSLLKTIASRLKLSRGGTRGCWQWRRPGLVD